MAAIDWNRELKPLLKQYKGRKHPLDYASPYQLLIMVILSAQDSDRHINALAPELFKAFPNMKALAQADEASLLHYIGGVRNARNQAEGIMVDLHVVRVAPRYRQWQRSEKDRTAD